MKTILLYKITLVLTLLPLISSANNDFIKGKYTKEKTINKEFNVNADATLKVDNSFGNIKILTWDENRTVIDVVIKVSGNNEEKVNERLQGIDVEFNATSSLVSAVTKIQKNKKNWWNWGKKMNLSIEVNYTVRLPITNNVDLSNDYGGIDLERLEGSAEINCDYGRITTQELMGENNKLVFDYTNNCYFEYINSGSINADYSSYTVAKAKDLDINADYTKSEIEIAETINYNCDYNTLKVGKVNSISGNGDYLAVRLGDVYKNVEIKADYGSIGIGRMASNAGDVIIDSEYSGIKIGYDSGYKFSFEIDLEYAGLKGTDNFEFNKKRIESGEKYYQGYHGSANSGNTIRISSEYGSVKFEQNNQ